MTKLHPEGGWPDDAHGRAHMQLARVADTIGIQGSPLDPHERIGALIEMQDIDRNDLPGDLQALYDEIETYLGEATG